MQIFLTSGAQTGLTNDEICSAVLDSLSKWQAQRGPVRNALLIPPDFTRYHSNAGLITNLYWHALKDTAQVDILPALGTHAPMTQEECADMYGDIPFDRFIRHNWRTDVVKLGEVPAEFLSDVSEGLWREAISVEINRLIMDEKYDLIVSVGQVVPHEVIGMANHSKNLFVGCGGSDMISKSHMLGAVYGMEHVMGRDHSPVRKVFDYALARFLKDRPLLFALTVTTAPGGVIQTHGLFIGEERDALEAAIGLAQRKNIDFVEKPIRKCVVYLDPKEFKSTWLGNKAVYRTRMAIADGGELIVLAPGVQRFGEDEQNDRIIRRYGYCGRLKTLDLFRENEDLRQNMSAAAHLIHGSSDGRFRVTYAVKAISEEEIASVHFTPASYDAMAAKYPPSTLAYGWNVMPDGEEIYYIPNPALGLWIDKGRFSDR